MAVVTDLYGNKITEVDSSMLTGSEFSDDSNINVFEFANVLLAGILPTLIWIVSTVADLTGDTASTTDTAGSSLSSSDTTGVGLTASDIAGGTVSEEDVTEIIMSVTDFLSSVNDILGVEGISLSVSEWGGNTVPATEVSLNNSLIYDFGVYAYDNPSINYEGVWVQGTVMDISGS